MNDSDLRFRATFDDDVSSKVAALEAKLKRMGATPAQIKMIIKAQDETEPKLKRIRENIANMSKNTVWHLRMNTDEAIQKLKGVRKEAEKPIKLTFVHNLSEVTKQLGDFSQRSRLQIPFANQIPGGNVLYAGGAAGLAMGPLAAAGGLVGQGVKVNSDMEQSQVTLNQTLKDNTKATQEMSKLVEIAKQTPFSYHDILEGDVRLRSYNIPTMQGEGGPQNKGWLNSAGEMAAAMNTPITQAVEAVADARQGYFVRMMSYGIRMMKEDFSAGGKYAGMTYEQGLEQAIRRFTGSMEAQSKTFKGIMSNLGDVMQQSILKPIGAAPFAMAKSGAEGVMKKMQTDDFQEKVGKTIEDVSHRMIEMYDTMQKGKQYFEENLLQPLLQFGKQVAGIGSTFIKAFGGPLLTALKTVATILSGIAKPVVAFVSEHPRLVQMYATYKALSMLGFSGPVNGFKQMTSSMNVMHFSLTGIAKGFHEMLSGSVKLGVAALVAELAKGARASNNLKAALKEVKASDEFKNVNAELSRMAIGLDTNTAKMKQLGAQAIGGLKKGTDTSVGVYQAGMAQTLSQYGINAETANSMMSKNGVGSKADVDKSAIALRQLAAAADVLKLSFSDAVRIMQQFGTQAGPIGLGGLKGAPYLSALSSAVHDKDFQLNGAQRTAGIFTGDALMSQMMGAYKSPSVEQLQRIGPKGMDQFYKYSPMYPEQMAGGLQSMTDVRNRYSANVFGFDQMKGSVNALTRKAGMSDTLNLPQTVDRNIVNTVPDINKLLQTTNRNGGGSGSEQAAALNKAIDFNAKQLVSTNADIDSRTEKINQLNKAVNQWTISQEALGMKMQAFNHDALLPMQQAIEDAQLAMQKYQFSAVRPLERAMQRLSDKSTVMANAMNKAQYSMSIFNTGLLDGEQAALNQLHALEQYNRQLQILQLQMQTMGASLGQTTYDGATAVMRVNPLSQVSTEMQMEQLQRKSQLKQLQYEAKYGEGHYKMGQAARTKNERREMGLDERLEGIKKNRKIIDSTSEAQQKLTEQQGDLQVKMNKANEVMADQQDAITKVSIALQDKQLHGGLREMQEAQYQMGLKASEANRELNKQNILMDAAKERLTDYREIGKVLADTRDRLWKMQSPEDAARALVAFSAATGIIDKNQAKSILDMLTKTSNEVKKNSALPKDKTDWIDTIARGLKMAFTGDIIRVIGDQLGKVPGVGGALSSNTAVTAATAGVVGLGALTMVPLAIGVVSEVVKRGAISAVLRGLPGAGKLDELMQGVGKLGSKIPGIRGLDSVKNLADDGIKGLSNTKFLDIFKDSMQFIKRFRGIIGGAAGAAVGSLIGGPVGGIIGGIAGTRYGSNNTARKAVRDAAKAADKISDAAKDIQKGGAKVAEIGKEATKIRLRGVGAFSKAVGAFAGIAAALKGLLPDKIPVVKPPKVPRVPDRIDDAARGASRTGEVAKGAGSAAQRAGGAAKKVGRAAKKALPWVGAAAVGSELAQGDYLDALNTGSYFIPIVGEARIAGDIWKEAYDVTEGMYNNPVLKGATPGKRTAFGRANSTAMHQMTTRKGFGALDPNLSDDEKRVLEKNRRRQAEIAQEMTDRAKQGKNIDSLWKNLAKKQMEYDSQYRVFSKDKGEEWLKMNQLQLDSLVEYQQTAINKRQKAEVVGFKDIERLTDTHLTNLHKRLNTFKRQMGITSDYDTDSGSYTPGSSVSTDDRTSGGSFAHGTDSLAKHMLKGKGDSKGYLIRVGEESDEAIIPMAPHRRDRAKSLVKQLAGRLGMAANGTDGAYLAARKAVTGFANGGFTKHTAQIAEMIQKRFHPDSIGGWRPAGDGYDEHSTGRAMDIMVGNSRKSKSSKAKGDSIANWLMKNGKRLLLKWAIWRQHINSGSGWRGMENRGDDTQNHFDHVHAFFNDPSTGGGHSFTGAAGNFSVGGDVSAFKFGKTPAALKKMGIVGRAMFKAISNAKNKLRGSIGGGIDTSAFKGATGPAQAKKWIAEGMKLAGVRGGAWMAMLLNQARRESNFDPNAINNWDSNAKAGTPSKGFLQTIDSTFKSYKVPGHNNIFNPVDNVAAAIRYMIARYGAGNQQKALQAMIRNGGGGYAAGLSKVAKDWMPAILHRGERVLNPAQVTKADGDARDDTKKRNMFGWIEGMNRNVEKMLKALTHANERDDKPKDKDLSALNAAAKKNWGQTSYTKTSPAVKNMKGDKSEGEGTVAKVANEQKEFKIVINNDAKTDAALVTEMKNLVSAAKSLEKTAKTPRQKTLAKRAVTSATRAQKSAQKVTAYTKTKSGKKASAELSRNEYLVGAAKRGVNSRLIKDVTGKALSTKKQFTSKGTLARKGAKNAVSQKQLYEKAAKAKPGSKAQDKALAVLQKALKSGLSAQSKKLYSLRTTATKDAAKARKDFAAAAKSQVKSIASLSKGSQKTLKELQKGHSVSKTALSKLKSEVTKSGSKTAKATTSSVKKLSATAKKAAKTAEEHKNTSKDSNKTGKDTNKATKKADEKREKAEVAQDKREREHFKKMENMMDQLLKKPMTVNVNNTATGATIKSEVKGTKRSK